MSIDIKKREIYEGYGTKQKKGVIEVFDKFFEVEKFDIIIELGTRPGGFAIYLAKKAQEMGSFFYTFDIKGISPKSRYALEQNGGVFFKGDVNQNAKLADFIKSKSRVLILNDGVKFDSFLEYAPMLKYGDYMFIHDYYEGKREIFDGVASYDDLELGLKKFNLEISKCTKIFKDYLWICLNKREA
jgi:cephalosporin hydroxylase